MQLLLDTHTLLWWLTDNKSLSRPAHKAIADLGNVVFVSAASAWEIATKYRVGKLPVAAQISGRLAGIAAREKFLELAISMKHAELAGSVSGEHRDPFDRMLIGQALAEGLTLVSNERLFDSFGVSRLW